MKHGAVVMLVAVLLCGGARAQSQGNNARPVGALGWLVGGVWAADASKMGAGVQRVETRYTWSDNNAYIRFNTHFVAGKQVLHSYDGNFFWDPEKATLAMWYMNTKNEIMQGPVKIAGNIMTMEFRAKDSKEKDADFRVSVTRKTDNDYAWLLEEKQPEGWKQLLALEYLRARS